jgi:hypothetical protein
MALVTQTAYADRPVMGLEGQIWDMTDNNAVVSRLVETVAGIGFGKAVIQGTADAQVKLGAAGVYIGVTVIDRTLLPEDADTYAQNTSAAVLIKGSFLAKPIEAVVAGDPVYRTATGTLGKTASGNTLIANAMWETSAAANGIAVIRLR